MADIAHLTVIYESQGYDKVKGEVESLKQAGAQVEAASSKAATGTQRAGAAAAVAVGASSQRVRALTQQMSGLERSVRGLGDVFKHAFGGLIAFGAVAAIADFVRSIGSANLEMQKMLNTLNAASGSMTAARSEFSFLAQLADKLGTDLQGSADGYARLAVSARSAGLSTAQLHKSFVGLSEGFAATGRSGDEMNRFLVQMEQGLSQGTLHMRDLRSMAQSFPSAFEIAGEAAQRMGSSLQDFLTHGGLPAREFFLTFSQIVHEKFADAATQAANTLVGQMHRLHNAMFEIKTDPQIANTLRDALKGLVDALNEPSTRAGIQDAVKSLANGMKDLIGVIPTVLRLIPELITAIKLLADVMIARLVVGGIAKAITGFGALSKAITEFMAVQKAAGIATALAGEGRRLGVIGLGASLASRAGLVAGAGAAGAAGVAGAEATAGVAGVGAAAAGALLPVTAIVAALGALVYVMYKVQKAHDDAEASFNAVIKSYDDAGVAASKLTVEVNNLAGAQAKSDLFNPGPAVGQMSDALQKAAEQYADVSRKMDEAKAKAAALKAELDRMPAVTSNMASSSRLASGALAYQAAQFYDAKNKSDEMNERVAALSGTMSALASDVRNAAAAFTNSLSPALADAYRKTSPFLLGAARTSFMQGLVSQQAGYDSMSATQLALQGKDASQYQSRNARLSSLSSTLDSFGTSVASAAKAKELHTWGARVDNAVSLLDAAMKNGTISATAYNNAMTNLVPTWRKDAAIADASSKTHAAAASHASELDRVIQSIGKSLVEAQGPLGEYTKHMVDLTKAFDEDRAHGMSLQAAMAKWTTGHDQITAALEREQAATKTLNAEQAKQYQDNLTRAIQLRTAQGLLSNRQDQMGPLQFQQQQSLLGIQQQYQQAIATLQQQKTIALLQPGAYVGKINSKFDSEIKAQQIAQTADLAAQQQLYNDKLEQMQKILPGIKGGFQEFADTAMNLTGQMHQAVNTFLTGFADGLSTMLTGSKFSFKELLRSFLQMVNQMITRWLILQAIMGIGRALGGTAGGSGFASVLASGFSGGRAIGGPVMAGNTYIVGERGPELFTPNTSGHITPNNKISSGRPISISYNIDARGAGPDEVAKLAQMRVETIRKVHSDVVHYDKYGYFPSPA